MTNDINDSLEFQWRNNPSLAADELHIRERVAKLSDPLIPPKRAKSCLTCKEWTQDYEASVRYGTGTQVFVREHCSKCGSQVVPTKVNNRRRAVIATRNRNGS